MLLTAKGMEMPKVEALDDCYKKWNHWWSGEGDPDHGQTRPMRVKIRK